MTVLCLAAFNIHELVKLKNAALAARPSLACVRVYESVQLFEGGKSVSRDVRDASGEETVVFKR